MKRLIFIFSFVFILTTFAQEAYFLSDPTLSPNSNQIVFSYDGDLWKVPAKGGTASRLTGMDGVESDPMFSPDGKWIAFTGRQQGNSNVYLIPVEGGKIQQLTFMDASDNVESWSWDSKEIYFRSNRYNSVAGYKLSIDGGTPLRLFNNYFNTVHNIVVHPKTDEIFFNESWESYRFTNRKRYKGDYNPEIKSYNPKTKEYKEYTDYEGKDFWTTIDKNGNIYFVSDEFNDEYNLYKLNNGNKKRLTDFETSIKNPNVSADGDLVVFERDYQIYVYDTKADKAEKVNIDIFDNNTLTIEQEYKIDGKISSFDVSPDKKKMAFVSRGILFISDAEGKFIRKIETDPKERVKDVKWLKDNKTILFTQTNKGWTNLYKLNAENGKEIEALTDYKMNVSGLTFSDDRAKALYFAGRNNLNMMDLETFDSETIVEDEFWALYSTPAYFSPDDKYIVYTAYRNFENDILIYSIDEGKSYNITKTGVSENNPMWSPDGKYIFFNTDRFHPSYPTGTRNEDVYRIALKKFSKQFKSDEVNKLFTDVKKENDSVKTEVEINFNNFKDRWESVVSKPLHQYLQFITQDKETTYMLYTSYEGGSSKLMKAEIKPFEKMKTEEIKGIKGYVNSFSKVNGDLYALSSGNVYKLNLKGNKADKVSISAKFSKNLANEFEQMFYEAWAGLEENYYDESFHGIDWEKAKNKYAEYLPHIRSRNNLRKILSDMLGELNSSHLGFYSNGKEEKVYYKSRSIATGIMFDNENPYNVDFVIENSPSDKEDIDLQKGDKLLAVNGKEIEINENREKYFNTTHMFEEISLTFERNGNEFTINIHPTSSGSIRGMLYDRWEEKKQQIVDELSDKKIAYIHMKNMGGGELNKFLIEIANEEVYRDGLILDLRYNTGGNVHDKVLQTLSQKPYMKWKYREGDFSPQPNFAPSAKPIVLLINEQSLSDAEMTAAGFKELNLGTIVGTETYRWLIFTSGSSLVDGSFYRLPSWGCYTLDGKDIETNGVEPDVYIKNNFKHRLDENDVQLKKAVEIIKNDWNN